MKIVIWKKNKDFPNWLIGSNGQVYSYKKKELLKINPDNSGYPFLMYRENGKCKLIRVHRLVMLTFRPKKQEDDKIFVNHINRNRADNRLENLEWVTPKENSSIEKGNSPLGLKIGGKGKHSRRKKDNE